MGRREIFSWGGGYLENEEKRESKGIISLLPILIQGPPREILSSLHFWFFWCGSIWDLYHFDLCLCKKNFDVSASRSSPICLLVLLFWSFAKLELREIIFSLFQGKKFTCLLTGHPLFSFWFFWFGPMRNLKYFGLWLWMQMLTCLLAGHPPFAYFSSFGVVLCKIERKRNPLY